MNYLLFQQTRPVMKKELRKRDTKVETTEAEELKQEIKALNKRIDELNINEVRGRIVATNEWINTLEQKLEEHCSKESREAHKTRIF